MHSRFLLIVFSSVSLSQPIVKCKRVFQALINVAIEELCEIADALVAPVRLGIARPTAPFSLVSSNIDAIQVSCLAIFHRRSVPTFGLGSNAKWMVVILAYVTGRPKTGAFWCFSTA